MSHLFSTVRNSLLIASGCIRNGEQQKVGTGGRRLADGKTLLNLAHRLHDRSQETWRGVPGEFRGDYPGRHTIPAMTVITPSRGRRDRSVLRLARRADRQQAGAVGETDCGGTDCGTGLSYKFWPRPAGSVADSETGRMPSPLFNYQSLRRSKFTIPNGPTWQTGNRVSKNWATGICLSNPGCFQRPSRTICQSRCGRRLVLVVRISVRDRRVTDFRMGICSSVHPILTCPEMTSPSQTFRRDQSAARSTTSCTQRRNCLATA